MRARKIWSCLGLTLGLLGGCSDEGDDSAAGKSPLVGTWALTTAETRIDTGPWMPGDACRTDNTEEYGANGDWTLYDGPLQCGSGDTGIRRGNWRVTAGGTKIVYTYDGISGEYESTIESLTENSLILSFSSGGSGQSRYTFQKRGSQ